jgi:hypothetical protein
MCEEREREVGWIVKSAKGSSSNYAQWRTKTRIKWSHPQNLFLGIPKITQFYFWEFQK